MKRWTLRILIYLTLGAATTLGVAWGLTWLIDLSDTSGATTQPRGIVLEKTNQSWIGLAQRRFGSSLFVSYRNRPLPPLTVDSVEPTGWEPKDIVPQWTGFHLEPPALGSTGCDLAVQMGDCRGWPFLALWSGETLNHRTNGTWVISDAPSGIDIGLSPSNMIYGHTAPRPIPLRPILPGFIINTLFYAAIWFAILFAPGMIRRALRRRRGRCVKCGYDLRGEINNGCPECGWNRSEPRL